MLLRVSILFLTPAVIFAQTSLLDEGVQASRQGNQTRAVELFEKAVQAEPRNVKARQFLGTAYLNQFKPGDQATSNVELSRKAESEFLAAHGLDATNTDVIRNLAGLQFARAQGSDPAGKQRALDEAVYWHNKLLAINPDDREAHYSLGVIAWAKVYPLKVEARKQSGMRPEDPGPIRDPDLRANLQSQNSNLIAEGIDHLERAIQIDSKSDNAMAYLNLLYRERADLRDVASDYQNDIALADKWVHLALETKKQQGTQVGRPAFDPGKYQPAQGTMVAVPPNTQGQAQHRPPVPTRIRVGGNVQQAKLIRQQPPVYPPLAMQARIQGTVRFDTTIGRDGKVSALTLVSGHPLLVTAASEALRAWEYQPTHLNGQPVEIVTQVDVNFTLSQ